MHIKSLELKNVRGIRHLKASALPETGVIVIHGDNEAGKSTILEALKIVLTEKHKSASDSARQKFAEHGTNWLKPVDIDEAPEITLELCVGDYELRLFKRYFKARKAELTVTSPRPENHVGDEAEARLQEILEESTELNLLKTLFLAQGEEGAALEAAGLESLKGALQQASGMDFGESAQEETALGKQVQEELSKYFTARTGKPTGTYAAAQKRVDAAQEQVDKFQDKVASLNTYLDGVDRARASLKDAQERLPAARMEVEEKRKEAEKAQEALEKFHLAQQELERAKIDYQRAQKDSSRREELEKQLAEAGEQQKALALELAGAADKAAQESQALETAKQQLNTARQKRDEVRKKVSHAKKELHLARSKQRFEKLSLRVEKLDTLHHKLQQARKLAAARGRVILDSDVSQAEKATNALSSAVEKQKLAAAKLFFQASEPTSITVAGTTVDLEVGQEHPVSLEDGATVEISGVTIRYEKGFDTGTNWAQEVNSAQHTLNQLLAELGCDDLDSVRNKRDEHRKIHEQVNQAKVDFEAELAGDDLDDLHAQLEALSIPSNSSSDTTSNSSDKTSNSTSKTGRANTVAEAEHACEEAEIELATAETALDRAQNELEPLNEKKAQLKLVEVKQKVSSNQDNINRISAELSKSEAETPSEKLLSALKEAKARVETQEDKAAELECEVKSADPNLSAKLFAGAKEKLRTIEKLIKDSERDIYKQQSYIDNAEGAEEDLQVATNELESAQTWLRSVERRALAAQKLSEVLLRHRDAARQRYSAPFAQKLKDLAQIVFGPDVSFNLDEELKVASRTSRGATVNLEDLSGGAKEQLGILTRFAIASLVTNPEGENSCSNAAEGVPIIVDDALGSTDLRRLERMATLFADVGKTSQVIVLTCMPQRYETIPGRTSLDIEALKRES